MVAFRLAMLSGLLFLFDSAYLCCRCCGGGLVIGTRRMRFCCMRAVPRRRATQWPVEPERARVCVQAAAVDEALHGVMPRSELDIRIVARDAQLVSALTGRHGSGE